MCRTAHAKSDSLERPLRCFGQFRREVEHLGRALLYADGTVEAHARVLREVFGGKAPQIGCEVSAAELQRMQVLYGRPHLPQGAPTSPAVANLCAFRLDCRLGGLAKAAEANYTRYADDLAFSGDAGFARGAGRFAARVAAIVAEEGFAVNFRKTRLMRQSVRQHLAGLTVNVRPHVSRQELDRLEAILTNCVRFGPEGQNREGLANFRRHLEGRVAFAGMVGGGRVARLRALLELIVWERERSPAL